MRKSLAITLSVAGLLAAPATLITASIATPAMAQAPAPTVNGVRSAVERAIRAAQAANRVNRVTGAAAEAAIQAAIQAAVIASNAPPSMVQTALASLGPVAREPGVAAAVAQVQQTVSLAVAQNSSTSGAAATSGSAGGAPSGFSSSPPSVGGGGGGGGDYRTSTPG